MGLSPVTYVTNKSRYLNHAAELNATINRIVAETRIWTNIEKVNPKNLTNKMKIDKQKEANYILKISYLRLQEVAHALFSYMKPYQHQETGQRFYDEREWRAVVPYNAIDGYIIPVLMPGMVKNLEVEKAKYQEKIDQENIRLRFNSDDIKYIIVEKDSDIKYIINALKSIPGRFEGEDIERLTTRILTTEQIREDF